jgi:hypothetical protein
MLIFLSLPIFASPLSIAPLRQDIDGAYINWTQMRLEAKSAYASRTQSWGYRESLACQAVSKKIREFITDVPVFSNETISSLQEMDEINGDFIDGLRDWKTAESRYIHSEHEVEVLGYLSLQGYLRKSLMHFAKSDNTQEAEIHTGLLIDARGIDFQPLVMPDVYNSKGVSVLDITNFSPKAAQDSLPVRYVRTPVDPLCAEITGKTPAMVQAASSKRGGLVLSESAILPNSKDLAAISAQGSIVIILSPFE